MARWRLSFLAVDRSACGHAGILVRLLLASTELVLRMVRPSTVRTHEAFSFLSGDHSRPDRTVFSWKLLRYSMRWTLNQRTVSSMVSRKGRGEKPSSRVAFSWLMEQLEEITSSEYVVKSGRCRVIR
jgi:hypothetical protein